MLDFPSNEDVSYANFNRFLCSVVLMSVKCFIREGALTLTMNNGTGVSPPPRGVRFDLVTLKSLYQHNFFTPSFLQDTVCGRVTIAVWQEEPSLSSPPCAWPAALAVGNQLIGFNYTHLAVLGIHSTLCREAVIQYMCCGLGGCLWLIIVCVCT